MCTHAHTHSFSYTYKRFSKGLHTTRFRRRATPTCGRTPRAPHTFFEDEDGDGTAGGYLARTSCSAAHARISDRPSATPVTPAPRVLSKLDQYILGKQRRSEGWSCARRGASSGVG